MDDSTAMMLQVAIRCKPFTFNDQLGIVLRQRGEKNAEIETVNTDRTVRLPFSYAWWSAYGYKKRIQAPIPKELENIQLVSQKTAYDSIGPSMLKELTEGHAIVLFAYGLSGSGKTYTVFGIDDIHHPNAWFKFDTPQTEWGIFPRLVSCGLWVFTHFYPCCCPFFCVCCCVFFLGFHESIANIVPCL